MSGCQSTAKSRNGKPFDYDNSINIFLILNFGFTYVINDYK